MKRAGRASTAADRRAVLSSSKRRRPSVAGIVPRRRFNRVLARTRAPLVWVAAPAGAGKTYAVAGYLARRRTESLWYQVDAEDRDPATLVGQLAADLEGGRRTGGAPPVHLTAVPPELLRRHAELLFGKLLLARRARRAPLTLVLDNYQEAESSDAWNELIGGLASAWTTTAPAGSRVLVTSRRRPPASLARLVLEGRLQAIDPEALRFDEAELRALLRGRSSDRKVKRLETLSGGWAVAAALLARGTDPPPAATHDHNDDIDLLFDFLNAEVSRRLTPSTRKALARVAFVHEISPASVARLPGTPPAEQLVAEILTSGLPLTRTTDGGIRLHDLVRAFLSERLVRELSEAEQTELLIASAQLLAAEGHLQEAAALCTRCRGWNELADLIGRHAPALAAQGRGASVSAALQALPAERIDSDPWLGLWRAVCELPFDLPLAERRLVDLVDQFGQAGDPVRRKLAAAHAVQAVILRGHDASACVPLLEVLDEPLPASLPPAIESRVRASRLMGLSFLAPGTEPALRAADEALALPVDPTRVTDAVLALGWAIITYVNAGRMEDADTARRSARRLAASVPHDPVAQITLLHSETWFHSVTLNPRAALAAAEEALALGEASGVAVWRKVLAALGSLAALMVGDQAASRRCLALAHEGSHDGLSRYERGAQLYAQAHEQAASGDVPGARSTLRQARQLTVLLGFPYCLLTVTGSEMMLAAQTGDRAELEQIRPMAAADLAALPTVFMAASFELIDVLVELTSQGAQVARPRLAAALARVGQLQGLAVPLPRSMAQRLVGAALELDIERPLAMSIVRGYGLSPPPDDTGPVWPWPFRGLLLGDCQLESAEHGPVRPGAGPLRLFKALVAAGGAPIRVQRLVAELWPGSRASEARASFDTTLHRLRRQFADERLFRLIDGELSLDRERLWCDAWALAQVHRQVEDRAARSAPPEVEHLEARLRKLYRGPFCGDDPEPFLVRARGRLARLFAQAASSLAQRWSQLGHPDRAAALLQFAADRA